MLPSGTAALASKAPAKDCADPCAAAARSTVFVVSGDSAVRDSLAELLDAAGLRPEPFQTLEAWLAAVPSDRAGCLVLDARHEDFVPPGDGVSLSSLCASRPVLLLIDRGDVPVAVRAIREGAADVLEKPCRNETVLARIREMTASAQC